MVTTTQNIKKESSSFTKNISPHKTADDKTSVAYVVNAFSWDEIPPQKGFHTLDSLLELIKQSGAENHLAKAREDLAKIFSSEGVTLKSLRLEKNLSQSELANILDTNQYNISCYETGKNEMRFSTMRRMSDALSIDLNTLGDAIENTMKVHGK